MALVRELGPPSTLLLSLNNFVCSKSGSSWDVAFVYRFNSAMQAECNQSWNFPKRNEGKATQPDFSFFWGGGEGAVTVLPSHNWAMGFGTCGI